MTESEWLACADRSEMLKLLQLRLGARKLRLFALACCARVSHLLQGQEAQQAIAAVQRYAEGAIQTMTLRKRLRAMESARRSNVRPHSPQWFASLVFENVVSPGSAFTPEQCAQYVSFSLATATGHPYGGDLWTAAGRSEDEFLCRVLRDLSGHLFRPITLAPVHRTPAVVSLARAACDERHLPSGELGPHRLAVLADALEEAGAPAELVAHLRGLGPHVRGCWAVDLCLALS
jgi:hypothetical protein